MPECPVGGRVANQNGHAPIRRLAVQMPDGQKLVKMTES